MTSSIPVVRAFEDAQGVFAAARRCHPVGRPTRQAAKAALEVARAAMHEWMLIPGNRGEFEADERRRTAELVSGFTPETSQDRRTASERTQALSERALAIDAAASRREAERNE